MAEPLPPPPPPPSAVYALMQLLELVGLIIALGVASLWKQTFGAFFNWLAGVLNFKVLGVRPLGSIAHGMAAAESRVQNFFSHVALAREPGFTTFLTYTAKTQGAHGAEVGALAQDSYATMQRIQAVFVPWFVSHKTAPLAHTIGTATTAAHTATKAATHATAQAKAASHAAAQAKPIARQTAIAVTQPRVGALEHWERVAKGDISWLKKRFAPLAFAGLVGAALTRLGLNWVRCPQNKRFGRNLCGRPDWFLDAVIGALSFVVATEGLVPFARQVQGIVGDAEGFVRDFWHVSHVGQGGDRPIGSSTLS